MKARALLLASCLLGAPMVGWPADGPAPPAASQPARQPAQTPLRKRSFDLGEAEMRRFLSGQREKFESPEAVRIANDWRAGRASIAIQPPAKAELRPRPATVECDGLGAKCAAYDAAGNYLFALPNRRVKLGVNDPDTLNCGRASNLMSTFERADRCRGIGVVIPSFWEAPRVRYAP